MTTTVKNGRVPVKLGKRLQKNAELAAKVRELNQPLQEIIGKQTQAEWDLNAQETDNILSIHIGEPGYGECTRGIKESLLQNTPWLEHVFLNMKATLAVVQTFLAEVDKLFGNIRKWIAERKPNMKVVEQPIYIEEGLSGKYAAKKLTIRSPEAKAEIVPIAAWSAGTDGRVDLIGREQRYTLFYSKIDGRWFYVKERHQVEFQPLTPELLTSLVQDCLE